jgi:hypothetical protein
MLTGIQPYGRTGSDRAPALRPRRGPRFPRGALDARRESEPRRLTKLHGGEPLRRLFAACDVPCRAGKVCMTTLLPPAVRVAVALVVAATTAATATPPDGDRPSSSLCTTKQLTASAKTEATGMLHQEAVITLTNAGRSACRIGGFAAVRVLDTRGRVVATIPNQLGTADTTFLLRPHHHAWFRITYSYSNGVHEYPVAPKLAIIPPGDVAALIIAARVAPGPTMLISKIVAGSPPSQ